VPAQGPAGNGEVVAFGDPAWRALAMRYGTVTGRPVRWYDEIADVVADAGAGTGPLTVCARPEDFTSDVLRSLYSATSFRSPRYTGDAALPARAVSLLTARTLPIATAMVDTLAGRTRRPSTVAWVSTEPDVPAPADAELTTVPAADASAAHLTALAGTDLLMLWGHSREDLFHLGSDALCGASADLPAADPTANVPACMIDGRCIKDGAIVPIRTLHAGAVFLGGCNLLRMPDSSAFQLEFSLAFSALEGGATAVAASPGMRLGHPVEMLFLYRLLRCGLPLGEAVRLLNASLPHYGFDLPDYWVLGEGDQVFFPGSGPLRAPDPRPDGDGWTVVLPELDAEVVAVRVPVGDDGTAAVHPRLDLGAREARDVYFALVPEPDGGALLYLFGRHRLRAAELRLRLDRTPPAREARTAVVSALGNYEVYGRLLRGYQPKLKNQVQELASLATFLVRNDHATRYDLAAVAAGERKVDAAVELISRMDRALAEHYLGRVAVRAFVWHDECLRQDGTFAVVRHHSAGHCPYCGDHVSGRLLRAGLAPAGQRELGTCDRCGTVWDRPADAGIPTIVVPDRVFRETPTRVELRLDNPLDRPVRGWAGLRLRQSQRHGTSVDPLIRPVELAAGSAATLEFTLSVGASTPGHPEVVRAFFTSELNVTVAQRTVTIRAREDRPG
jgi:hypothetical protein